MAKVFTDESISEIIQSGQPVVVDFWAEWCGPCKAVAPIIDELSQEYEGKVVIGKYDVDEGGDFMVDYGIRNIPTILFFKDGELKDRNVGSISKDALEDKGRNKSKESWSHD